jgi:hypothetical protein
VRVRTSSWGEGAAAAVEDKARLGMGGGRLGFCGWGVPRRVVAAVGFTWTRAARWLPVPNALPRVSPGEAAAAAALLSPRAAMLWLVHRQAPRPLPAACVDLYDRWNRAGAGPGRQDRDTGGEHWGLASLARKGRSPGPRAYWLHG